jgi:23S rRNA (adenine2030-N6)-methyltransferase
MLAYRHAFHAGNHADVLKHLVLMRVLQHMNQKEKGWRLVDTHAGAGGYSLQGGYAQKKQEYLGGIGRLLALPATELAPAAAEYVACVRGFNPKGEAATGIRQYPGSPAFAQMFQRPQDQLRFFELHPTEHKILAGWLGGQPGVEVHMADGFAALKSVLPPPTRRGVLLIDPPYEIKTDYTRTLAALREALDRFADGTVIVWMPQLQALEARQLPQRLKATAQAKAKKGWLLAKLTVAKADARGFGMLGSNVLVVNPPHPLAAELRGLLPWLARTLADGASAHALEAGGGSGSPG